MNTKAIAIALLVLSALAATLGHDNVAVQAQSSEAKPSAATAERASGEAIVPFRIRVPDAVLRDLKERLRRTRLPDEVEGSGWDYGVSLAYMKELVAYWRDTFDWRKREAQLNAFDQFITNIDGLDVHFIHQRSPNSNAMPLISLQGFPSSISEYVKVIGPLTDPVRYGGRAEDAFHFVTFSLPGIGFSQKPTKSGAPSDATIVAKLMARLGYSRYAVQGGDIGAIIGRQVAINEAQHVVGFHMNFCASPPPPTGDERAGVSEAEWRRMEEREAYYERYNTGWQEIQRRSPQTLGYAFVDSPVGQAAWLVEKWRSLCDCHGDPDSKFTKDEILTNVMIYWVTETGASSMRRYGAGSRPIPVGSHSSGRFARAWTNPRVEVPTACALFPGDATLPPRRWVEAWHNLTRWTEMPRGGHFAPLEEPELFVDDIRAFFRSLRQP